MTTTTLETKQPVVEPLVWARVWPSLSAALLGLVVIYGVGFAPLQAHNAAHDARHSAAFPCH